MLFKTQLTDWQSLLYELPASMSGLSYIRYGIYYIVEGGKKHE